MEIIREFTAKDTSDRTRLFAECRCTVCHSIFVRQKRQLNSYGTCSVRCTNVANGRTVICTCANCGELVFKSKSELAASKSGLVFCSRSCKDTAQTYMVEIQPDHYGTGYTTYREKAFKAYKPICCRCGYANILALEVHHKDRDRSNSDISNLEILCANCHTLEHKGLRTGVQR